MFFRIKLALAIGGAVLAYFGIQEFRVSMGTSTEAEEVSLAELEKGEELSNNHVLITSHIADYAGTIYEYEEGTQKVNHAYYPIISDDHKFFEELNQLVAKYPNIDDAPDAEYPQIDDFKVLIKTKRFKSISSIPQGLEDETSIQGLVINLVSGLDSEEEEMIQDSFPKLNIDQVLIVEDGREPASSLQSLGMIGGGVMLTLLGIGLFFVGSRQ